MADSSASLETKIAMIQRIEQDTAAELSALKDDMYISDDDVKALHEATNAATASVGSSLDKATAALSGIHLLQQTEGADLDAALDKRAELMKKALL